jgi:hypothetical protein
MKQTGHTLSALLLAILSCGVSMAQSEEQVAYVATRTVTRTADDPELGFRSGAVAGSVEFAVPKGTHRVDVLNARGNVVRTLFMDEVAGLKLGDLSRGTWTLRAHTASGLSIRRFIVLGPGQVAWAVPAAPKRR